jgi:hypothetical protein
MKFLEGDPHKLQNKGTMFAQVGSKTVSAYYANSAYALATSIIEDSRKACKLVDRLEEKKAVGDGSSAVTFYWTLVENPNLSGDCIKVGVHYHTLKAKKAIARGIKEIEKEYTSQNLTLNVPYSPLNIDAVLSEDYNHAINVDAIYVPFEHYTENNLTQTLNIQFTNLQQAMKNLDTELINILSERFARFMNGHAMEKNVNDIIYSLITNRNQSRLRELYRDLIYAVSDERLEDAYNLTTEIRKFDKSF